MWPRKLARPQVANSKDQLRNDIAAIRKIHRIDHFGPQITCGVRTRGFSGKGTWHMGAETGRERAGATIRAFRAKDVPALTSILREAPEAANWTQASYRELMNSPGAVALVSESDGRVTGFIIGRQVADEAEVLNLAVEPRARRMGQGGALLKAALEEFQALGVRLVYLEVRESNVAARAFYAKHGFSQTGKRLKYYRKPEEAAIVMEKKFEH